MTTDVATSATPPRFALEARAMDEAADEWDAVLDAAVHTPPSYTRALIEYQRAYVRGAADELVDLSRVVRVDGKPVAAWPLSLVRTAGSWRIGSQEAPVRPPLFASTLPEITRKRVVDACWDWLQALALHHGLREIVSVRALRGEPLDEWHRKAMEGGAVARLRHGLYVDLSIPREKLWLTVRKSYRPLVNKGKALWRTEIVDDDAARVMDEYHALHRAAAGRETRAPETWAAQQAAVSTRDAFLVLLRDEAGRLVGGGLFARSKREAMYAVGAYDRALFENPLGHVVQWEAICYMQDKGLAWYFIGERPYSGDDATPSDKELAIARFKEGFATHAFPHVELRRPARAARGVEET